MTPTHTQELEMLELNKGQKDLIGKGICGPSLALDDSTLHHHPFQVLFSESIVCQQYVGDRFCLLLYFASSRNFSRNYSNRRLGFYFYAEQLPAALSAPNSSLPRQEVCFYDFVLIPAIEHSSLLLARSQFLSLRADASGLFISR